MSQKLQHIAFIMDGNRRWATAHGLPKMEGHTKGLENFKTIVEACAGQKIPYITFWALSTENLKKRSAQEVSHLFKLLSEIRNYLKDFVNNDARVKYIGDLTKLPSPLKIILKDIETKTKSHKSMTITLAINYGGRDEIIRMVKSMVKLATKSSEVNDKSINDAIDTGKMPPVDLMIRTGGHRRLSGFLPWIIDYAELYFTDKMWPEFKEKDLNTAIEWYAEQQRNFGK